MKEFLFSSSNRYVAAVTDVGICSSCDQQERRKGKEKRKEICLDLEKSRNFEEEEEKEEKEIIKISLS